MNPQVGKCFLTTIILLLGLHIFETPSELSPSLALLQRLVSWVFWDLYEERSLNRGDGDKVVTGPESNY